MNREQSARLEAKLRGVEFTCDTDRFPKGGMSAYAYDDPRAEYVDVPQYRVGGRKPLKIDTEPGLLDAMNLMRTEILPIDDTNWIELVAGRERQPSFHAAVKAAWEAWAEEEFPGDN